MVDRAAAARRRGGRLAHGQFLSTLDELDTHQDGRLRDCACWWIDGSHVVLRHAEVHKSRIPADPARTVSARYSRHATGNGLPVLSQLCRSSRAIERAEHGDMHELPHASGKR